MCLSKKVLLVSRSDASMSAHTRHLDTTHRRLDLSSRHRLSQMCLKQFRTITPMTQLKFYAEVLERIRSVSIAVELPVDTPASAITAQLSGTESSTITFNLPNNVHLSIPLHCRVGFLTPAQLNKSIRVRDTTLSMRLPLGTSKEQDRSSNSLMQLSTQYKWNAAKLRKAPFELDCSHCSKVILNSKDVSSISEMPSELWAEMMDFWHCHKPHDPHQHNNDLTERFSTIRPPTRSILTGSYYFAVNVDDDIAQITRTKEGSLMCSSCQTVVGQNEKGIDKLFKWCVTLNGDQTYKPHEFIYSSLLDRVNGSSTRLVQLVAPSGKQLLLWVFNVGIQSITRANYHQDAIKLYYATEMSTIDNMRQERGEMESIDVPENVLVQTLTFLETQREEVPTALASLDPQWKLGILSQNE